MRTVWILMMLLIAGTASAEVLFETSFEGPDWTHTQTKSDQTCLSGCGMPNGFQAFRDGLSYCTSVGNNNFYMATGAGFPGTTSSCHSGSKCLTFWTERCVDYFEDSDGNVGFWFDKEPEVYVAFRIRFDPNYVFNDEGQEKLFHLQYSTGGQTPWSYFSGTLYNFPVVVGGMYRYSTSQYYYVSPRCTYYSGDTARCNVGTPAYCPPYGSCDMEMYQVGAPSLINDGQWHHVEWRFKMNSGSTGNFNADGIYQFWYDGVLRQTINTIPWNKNEPTYAPRGWKFFSIGGNNLIKPTSASNAERWWAVDDLVISTSHVGPNYVVGGAVADAVRPNITIAYPSGNSSFVSMTPSITLGGSTADNVGVTQVTWSSGAGSSGTATLNQAGAEWVTAGINLLSGENVITVTARDAAGNSATDTMTVTYTPVDTVAPTVTITSPASGTTYSTYSANLDLGGTASDTVGVTQVNWSNSAGGSGSAAGTISWAVSGITLQPGANTITVTARDAAGNQGADVLTVTYAPTSCTIDGVCGVGETCTSCNQDCAQRTPADNNPCDGCISIAELSAFIDRWREGTVVLANLMESIGIWKGGCIQ